MAVVLASGSPRRRELMEMFRIPELKIMPADAEEAAPPGLDAEELVKFLAMQKAAATAKKCTEEDTVIGADTVVDLDGRVLGKPENAAQAKKMLQMLSGRTHRVWTGVAVLRGKESVVEAEMTSVRFREMTEREINAYIATGEPMDKAGAYGAQGIGSMFVERIDGDFFNVMGLPVCRLGRILNKMGVNLL